MSGNGNGNGNGSGTALVASSSAGGAVRLVAEDNLPMLDTAKFDHMYRIAQAISQSSLTPKHLKGGSPQETANNCFRVVNQAVRWGFDPFSVIDETYVVGGKLAYQGKLVSAVINARSGIVGRLSYEYRGTGDDRTVTVSGTFPGETKPRTVDLTVGQAKTQNEMWRKDPDQKLAYSGATKWARRHAPEVMLGVLTDDDLERMSEGQQATARPKQSIDELVAAKAAEQPAAQVPAVEPPKEEPTLAPGERMDDDGELKTWHDELIADYAAKLGEVVMAKLSKTKVKTLGQLQTAIEAGKVVMPNPDLEHIGSVIADVSIAFEQAKDDAK